MIFSKLTGLIATLLTILQGFTHEQIVAFFTPILGATGAQIAAAVVIAFTAIIVALSHAQTGTGGTAATNDPTANRGLFVNMLTK